MLRSTQRIWLTNIITAVCESPDRIAYWHDRLGDFRLSLIEPEFAAKWKDIPADEARRAVALKLRDEFRDLFDGLGGLHLQVGKYYPFKEIMNNDALPKLLEGVKSVVDPGRLMNPGALGLR